MLNNHSDIKNMSEEELLTTIDRFLNYLEMPSVDLTIRQRKKHLKEAIRRCQNDSYIMEYYMANSSVSSEIQAYQERIDANNMLISDIRSYKNRLPKHKINLLKRKERKH